MGSGRRYYCAGGLTGAFFVAGNLSYIFSYVFFYIFFFFFSEEGRRLSLSPFFNNGAG
jgi:hypothetical protein